MPDPKIPEKWKITDHFKRVDKGKKENARPAASKKRKQVDGCSESSTKRPKGNGRGRNASTSKSPAPAAKQYATPKSMVKGQRNPAASKEEPVIDLTLDDADNRTPTPEPSHAVTPPTPVSIPDHGLSRSPTSFFSRPEHSGVPSTPVRRHITYSGVSSIPRGSTPIHDSPLKRLSRRHTMHTLRSPSVIPSSQPSQDDQWLALSIIRVTTPPPGPPTVFQNVPMVPPLAFDENLSGPSSPQPVEPAVDDDCVQDGHVVPTSQSQEISLTQLSPRRIRAGLLFSSCMPKPGPLDIVPTSQSQSEVETTDISWTTSRSLGKNFVRSASTKGWRLLGRSQSNPGLDITHIFEDDDTDRRDSLPTPSMTQYTSSTDSDPEYDDYPFSTNPADRPPVNLTQNSSATESDPDYEAYPFSTNPADRPTMGEDGDTTIVAPMQEEGDTMTGTCPEEGLPDAVKDFRDMFGVGDGSYPEDFPMSLR